MMKSIMKKCKVELIGVKDHDQKVSEFGKAKHRDFTFGILK